MAKDSSVQVLDRDKILAVLNAVSPIMVQHIMATPNAEYALFYKSVTHSDLSSGKRTKASDGYEKNILYYLTVSEMEELRVTQVAHQSNIGVPNDVCRALGVNNTKGTVVKFKLVNDSAKYFVEDYTRDVVTRLGKTFKWDNGQCQYAVDGDFTDMHMTYGDHGFGTSNDPAFQSLRKNIFVNDTIYFLVETIATQKTLYVLLSKNPKFFDIQNIKETPWNSYLGKWSEGFTQAQLENADLDKGEYIRRTLQEPWKELLAKEMMNYASSDTDVFCPLTGIRGKFEDLKMLFIASHIKRHADSSIHEKYDINNGLLLCANADALFDKYMITISEDKELLFSFLIKDHVPLIDDLRLNHQIFKHVLTDKRMEYMKEHRRIFEEKEQERAYVNSLPPSQVQQVLKKNDLDEFSYLLISKKEAAKQFVAEGTKEVLAVSSYENIGHLKWIRDNKIFMTSVSRDSMDSSIPKPDILVLYHCAKPEVYKAYRVANADFLSSSILPDPFKLDIEDDYLTYALVDNKSVDIDIDMIELLDYAKKSKSYMKDLVMFVNV